MRISDEKKLILKAQKDPRLFGEIFEKYFDQILNYAFRRVGDFDIARDISSEVFLKAYTNLWRFKWRNVPLSAWLYRIATNEMNQYYRRKAYTAKTIIDQGADVFLKYADPSSLEAEREEANRRLEEEKDFRRIRGILDKMDIKYQEVIALRFFEQQSIKEICLILGKKEGTIKSLIHRGLEIIRRNLLHKSATTDD